MPKCRPVRDLYAYAHIPPLCPCTFPCVHKFFSIPTALLVMVRVRVALLSTTLREVVTQGEGNACNRQPAEEAISGQQSAKRGGPQDSLSS
jgi:hypothetical protein